MPEQIQNFLKKLKRPALRLWDRLDPKLKYTILSYVVSAAITRYAIDLDPETREFINLTVAGAVGYSVSGKDAKTGRKSIVDDLVAADTE